MNLMDKMEQKFGRGRGPNLMLVLIGCYAVGFVVSYIFPAFEMLICFNPELILKGQVWRIITFVFTPNASNLFLAILTCYIYFSISKALEQIIGKFRLNFFLILGLVLEIIAGFIYYYVCKANVLTVMNAGYVMYLNPYYLYAMLFVLFAMIFPDARFLFMLFIPVRGRWMVFITLALYMLDVAQAFANGMPGYGWLLVTMIIAALLTVIIFIVLTGQRIRVRKRSNVVNMKAYSQTKTQEKKPRHKCAVCGRTELSNPELDFRYCSKCQGDYEYCSEHLYTHMHVGGTDL